VLFTAVQAQEKGVTIPVLIEIDCDGHRSGVTPDDPLLVEIGRLVENEKGVILRGVLTHAGGSYKSKSVDDIRRMAETERSAAVKSAEILRGHGLSCPVVSIGSTPTVTFARDFTGVSEVRAGVYLFQDLVMAGLGVCRIEDIALSVLSSVIGHRKEKGWVIIDAGWMALSRDRGTAGQKLDQGYGVVCDIDGNPIKDLIVKSTNQEHGVVVNRNDQDINWEHLKIGRALRILPNHACATAAMFDRYHVISGSSEVADIWYRINGW
jgi:D-serine deaminase-like pyridoxal phosphate-dependent protein